MHKSLERFFLEFAVIMLAKGRKNTADWAYKKSLSYGSR
ncbi:hypothetical protein JOD17_000222 [Geomicrobium sediminis]|uniref:Uncharacterized protein n=1 Tax=Geomicrobium sediminis TaxID=1347788 RepID=A0ABS2P813_9BACL|nr:hypothetical protein [Geomicrobium sediminis]